MSAAIEVTIEGIGLFAPGLPNWETGCGALSGVNAIDGGATAGPSPALLAPNERRRAPASVLLALNVAEQACAMAQRDPRDLPNVFASAYGDLAINDYLCAVLARTPLELSPTKFHNSVHNAPAGYWTIATSCMASSSAVAAGSATFGAGLLEAALLARSESTPVLFAAFDIAAQGPLGEVIECRAPFGVAFVLAPHRSSQAPRLRLNLIDTAASELAPSPPPLHDSYAGNPIAASLPLLAALARHTAATLAVAAAPFSTLLMEISF